MMTDNTPTLSGGEVTDGDRLQICDASINSPETESLESSDAYSDTSYAYEASSESSQESDTSCGYEASSVISEDESESSSSGSIHTPDRNNIMERYVPTPISSRKRMRSRRLDFNDKNLVRDRLSGEENESDEPEAKRVPVTKWIGDMEQLFELRRPTSSGADDDE